MATCSSDSKIKIYDCDANGNWTKSYEFQGHDSAIWKVKFAHPDFGNILATCSYDKSVGIWEEKKSITGSDWAQRARLIDARESIEDLKFGPRYLGLQLLTGCADGTLRIYEA